MQAVDFNRATFDGLVLLAAAFDNAGFFVINEVGISDWKTPNRRCIGLEPARN
jgi:hypothetical protein